MILCAVVIMWYIVHVCIDVVWNGIDIEAFGTFVGLYLYS